MARSRAVVEGSSGTPQPGGVPQVSSVRPRPKFLEPATQEKGRPNRVHFCAGRTTLSSGNAAVGDAAADAGRLF
jgi:hypothetical protein